MFTARQFKVSTHSSKARLFLALAVVLSTVSVSAKDDNDDKGSPSQLDGLWELSATNLTPEGFLPDPVFILGNFTRDGSFLNTSTHPESGVPVSTAFGTPCCLFTLDAGQAHWIRTGPRRFVLETWRFVFGTEGFEAFTGGAVPAGAFVGYVQAQSDVTLNKKGDRMAGRARFQLLNLNKEAMAPPVVADITGSRIPLIPIPIP